MFIIFFSCTFNGVCHSKRCSLATMCENLLPCIFFFFFSLFYCFFFAILFLLQSRKFAHFSLQLFGDGTFLLSTLHIYTHKVHQDVHAIYRQSNNNDILLILYAIRMCGVENAAGKCIPSNRSTYEYIYIYRCRYYVQNMES